VNLHFSILPAWRGAAPVQHAVINGDRETGVTCFVLDKGMDTGGVLLVERSEVGPEETSGQLTARLADLGAPVLVRAVKGLVDGSIEPQPQDHDAATYAPKIANEDARIDWTQPAARVHDLARGLNPVPGAYTTFDGERLKVHRCRQAEGAGAPGEVVRVEAEGPVVATGEGAVLLTEVQPAGKARMSGEAFVNGYRPEGSALGAE
jgi:methionyl-tRNA formyltransferase